MEKRFKKFLLVIFLVFPIQISVPAYSSSDDWSSCVDDLESLKSASPSIPNMTHQDGSKFLEEYGKKVEKEVKVSV